MLREHMKIYEKFRHFVFQFASDAVLDYYKHNGRYFNCSDSQLLVGILFKCFIISSGIVLVKLKYCEILQLYFSCIYSHKNQLLKFKQKTERMGMHIYDLLTYRAVVGNTSIDVTSGNYNLDL